MPAGSSLISQSLQEESMPTSYKWRFVAILAVLFIANFSAAQSNSGSVNGTVVDPTGAVVPNAKVEMRNPVSGFDRSTITDSAGRFEFTNIPFNPYHLTVIATGFVSYTQDVEPRSAVPLTVGITLKVLGSTTQVTVE